MATAPLDNLAAVPALAPERPVVWPRRTQRTLANGMQVVLVESHTIPKFDAQLLFRRGNASTAQETAGLAEMTASLVRVGTTSRSLRQIEEDLRRMGADLSTSAGADTSAISFSGLSEFSAELLALAADLAQNASFPEEEFERERRQRLEEVKIERATPGFLAGERIRQVLFGAHPYATVAPTEAQVAAYRREQIVACYKKLYAPGDALFLAVGAFSADRMMGQIESAFGSWRAPAAPEPAYPALTEMRGRRVHLVHLPGTVQAQVLVGNLAITRHHPDWMPLLLANAVFGGAFNSRLVINIREQKGYTYSPRSAVSALRQHGYFTAAAAVRNDVVAATLTEIFYELDRMRALPVGDDELNDTKLYLSGVFSLGLATQDGLAGQLATVYLNNLPENYLETYRDNVHALTGAEVLAAARKHFDSANAQIVVVGDRAQVEEQTALFGPLEIRDPHGQPL
ncbi:MAG: insulinase family protein [Acidobacteria bacterium]|nr:insulinase family protein [Acidobacteriota bacterium]